MNQEDITFMNPPFGSNLKPPT